MTGLLTPDEIAEMLAENSRQRAEHDDAELRARGIIDDERHLPGLHDQKSHGKKGAGGVAKAVVGKVVDVLDKPSKPAAKKAAKKPKKSARPNPRPGGNTSLSAAIASGVASEKKLGGGAQGLTKRVTFNDGTEAIDKTTKTIRGIGTAKDQQDAEELTLGLASRLGLSAPTFERQSESRAVMSIVPGAPAVRAINAGRKDKASSGLLDPDRDRALANSDQGRIVGLLDIIVNNTDRHGGNWLVENPDDLDNPGISVIDHGMAFDAPGRLDPLHAAIDGKGRFVDHYRSRTNDPPPLFVIGDNDVSPQDIETARTALTDLRSEFERLGRLDWYEGAVARLDLVAAGAKGTKVRIGA